MRIQNQNESALRDHVFATYISLRYGMVALGIAFPFLLWLGGKLLYSIDLQPSMSHYYFAPYPESASVTAFPMRGLFVGMLFAIGTGLFLYRGFTNWENIALNLAGVFAVLVALIPMGIDGKTGGGVTLHGTCAVLLFCCLAFVAVFCADATVAYLPPDPLLRARFRRRYKQLGIMMLLLPSVAYVLTMVTDHGSRLVFLAEALGVWCFAAYWWVKSSEMKASNAERLALDGKIRPPKRRRDRLFPTFSVEQSAE